MSASERKIDELEQENRKLKHLLTKQMKSGDTLWMESGVNTEGKPFVHIRWNEQAGQLSPDEARQHGLRMLECAEASESDSAVIRFLIADEGLKMTMDKAAPFLGIMREFRGGDKERSA